MASARSWEEMTFKKRSAESKRFLRNYPDDVPVFCKKALGSELPDFETRGSRVPRSMICSEFKQIIQETCNQSSVATRASDQTIYLLVGSISLQEGAMMSEVYDQYKSEDGCLYITYSTRCPDLRAHLYESRKFTDAVIKCGGQTISVHRAVLAYASPVFDSLFSIGMQETREVSVDIQDSPASAVELMVRCIYTRHVPTDEHLAELYVLANKYMIPWLVADVSARILNALDHANVAAILRVVCRHSSSGKADAMDLWQRLLKKVHADEQLMKVALEELIDEPRGSSAKRQRIE